jgi:anti-sigma factor RsiW
VDCKLIEPDLTPFHFGAATDVPRAELEAHLSACPRCLSAFFALKRAVENGGEERPSSAVQARLREAVAREFARPRQQAWLWGGAAAAVVVAAALLGFFTHSDSKQQPMLPPVKSSPQNIDSARHEPMNLDFI